MKSVLVNTAYAQGVNHADAIAAIVIMCLLREAEWRGINNPLATTAPVWCHAACHRQLTAQRKAATGEYLMKSKVVVWGTPTALC